MGTFPEDVRALAELARAIAWPVTVFVLAVFGYRHGVLGQFLEWLEPLVGRLKEVKAGPVGAKFDRNRPKSPKDELTVRMAGEVPPVPSVTAPSAPLPMVEAQAFVLRNQRGELRAIMWVTDDDTPSLMFFDPRGKRRLALDVIARRDEGVYEPLLSLQNSDGESLARLGVRPDGRPELGLIGGSDEGAVNLAIGEDGTAQLGLWDGGNKLRVMLRTMPDGDAGLALTDKTQSVRAAFLVSADGAPNLLRYSQES